MSSHFSWRLSADESLSSGGYRLIGVSEVVKHNGLIDTFYTFRIDPPDQSITCQHYETEHVVLSAQDGDGETTFKEADSPFQPLCFV